MLCQRHLRKQPQRKLSSVPTQVDLLDLALALVEDQEARVLAVEALAVEALAVEALAVEALAVEAQAPAPALVAPVQVQEEVARTEAPIQVQEEVARTEAPVQVQEEVVRTEAPVQALAQVHTEDPTRDDSLSYDSMLHAQFVNAIPDLALMSTRDLLESQSRN